jgi:hypothetical protein
MRAFIRVLVVGLVFSLGLLVEPVAACPVDSVQSGTVCMDKYEASVWNLAPVSNAKTKAKLVASIQSGTVTLANLQSAGAVELGLVPGDLAAASCPDTEQQVRRRLCRLASRSDARRVSHVVSSRGRGPQLAQAAADQPGVASGRAGDSGYRWRRRRIDNLRH